MSAFFMAQSWVGENVSHSIWPRRFKPATFALAGCEKGQAFDLPFPISADLFHLSGADHPFASGTATNRVASAVFTCIKTLCLRLVLASISADRTSPAFATALPPTLRIMSPV